MKENSIEEDIELLQDETSSLGLFFKCKGSEKYKIALEHILSDYKRVLEINEALLKENEELKKDYYNVINKIENKIDRFDYEFEKAKKQNNKDKSDYYWNLIINFTKLLESEE